MNKNEKKNAIINKNEKNNNFSKEKPSLKEKTKEKEENPEENHRNNDEFENLVKNLVISEKDEKFLSTKLANLDVFPLFPLQNP